jgi:hypothetical protein
MRGMKIVHGVAAMAVALILSAACLAADKPATRRVPLDSATIAQKADYVDNLTERSISSRTIEQSGNKEAKKDLDKARDLVRDARGALTAGELERADDILNAALKLVNAQTRSLSQDRVTGERIEEAYKKRLHAVRTFIAAYSRVAEEKGKGSSAAQQKAMLVQLTDEAEGLAAKGEMAEAKRKLDEAYRISTGNLRQMRGGETLVRTLKFATPKEEYEYELDRNDSYFMLLKIAQGDNPPSEAVKPQIERLRGTAEGKRRAGEQQAKASDYPAAIHSLEDSTEELLKAIRASGLFIPG